MNKLAIIGGSGLYNIDGIKDEKWITVKTPWGEPSDQILEAKIDNNQIFFYRDIVEAIKLIHLILILGQILMPLKQLGVTDILSVSAVGSLKEELEPGKFVLVDQFIDRTFARVKTFFDKEIVAHVSMAKPISPGLMKACEVVLKKINLKYQVGGTYLVMEGPQFSSLAESKLYRSWGCDVIGMTNMPEAKLAREAEIRYASVAMVTDYDCWHEDHDDVSVDQVIKTLLSNADNARKMIVEVVKSFEKYIDPKDPATNCLDTAIITDKSNWTEITKKQLKNIAGRVYKK